VKHGQKGDGADDVKQFASDREKSDATMMFLKVI
jgi:hypothetical protein